MSKRAAILLLFGASSAFAQPVLWTGNFTNFAWTNDWAIQAGPAGKRNIIGSTNIALVVDSNTPGGGFLRISYPAGSYGSPNGGSQFYGGVLRTNANTPRDSATLSYWVRFPTNFNYVLGGKLPGLYGGDGNTGTNFPTGADGFTTRLMWRTNGAGEGFPFLPDSPTNNLGTVLGRGNWYFAGDNRWHQIRQDVVLNQTNASNGYIRIWYDGVLAVDAPGLYFRSTNGLKLDGVLFQTFFGGGDPSYATPVATFADFAAFSASELNEIATPVSLSNYQASVLSQDPIYYFRFDGSLTNSATNAASTSLSLNVNGSGGGYHHDYFNVQSNSWFFTDVNDALWTSADLINGGAVHSDPQASGVGSLTLLFRALDSTNSSGQSFIFSHGNATSSNNAFGLFLENSTNPDPGALKLRVGNQTVTILPATNIAAGKWYHFALTYNESRNANEVTWSIGRLGGALTSGVIDINNNALVGDDGPFYIGNNAGLNNSFRNPGNGRVDELAIWHRELSTSEISNQFNIPFSPAILSIATTASNTVVSWPNQSRPWLILESTEDLAALAWTHAGNPQAIGTSLVVTNPIAVRRFYRLRDP